MAVYECTMTQTITVNIKADSKEEALWWVQTHDFEDVKKETTMYDIDYDESVEGETSDDYAIDISVIDDD